jgi:hypothetical protein
MNLIESIKKELEKNKKRLNFQEKKPSIEINRSYHRGLNVGFYEGQISALENLLSNLEGDKE